MVAVLLQSPIGDVFAAVRAVFVVYVEGEALGFIKKIETGDQVRGERMISLAAADTINTNSKVL